MKPETVAPTPEPSPDGSPLVSVQDLKTYYTIRGSFVDRLVGREAGIVRAVDGVSLDIRRGRGAGARRRVGQRKDDARPDPARARSLDEREHAVRRPGARRPLRARVAPAAKADPGRVPGSARLAQPGHDDRTGGRASAGNPRPRQESRAAPAPGHRGARALRPGPGRRLPREVPVRPLGRTETASRDRAGDHPQSRRCSSRTSPSRCWT